MPRPAARSRALPALVAVCAGGCSLPAALSCPPGDGLGAWTPVAAAGAPTHRYAHVLEPLADGVFVFGGIIDGAAAGGGARWLAATDRWTPLAVAGAPSARAEAAHTVVEQADGQRRVVIFGGQSAGARAPGADQVLADTAVWDADTGAWALLPAGEGTPPGRYRAALAAHPTLPRAYLVGGLDAAGPRRDAWELDLGVSPPRWTALPGDFPLRPAMDARPFMGPPLLVAVVPSASVWTGILVAVGPLGSLSDDGTRTRAAYLRVPGGDWILNDPAAAPPARAGASLAWAGGPQLILMHGGHDPRSDPGDVPGRYLDDTWAYVPPAPDHADPFNANAHAAGTHAFRSACAPGDGGATATCGAGDVSVPRAFHGSAWTGDGLLVTGGLDPGSCGGGAFLDLATGQWLRASFQGSPPRERLPGMVYVDGLGVLVTGGHRPSSLAAQPARQQRWAP